MAANPMRFTITTKYITSEISNAIINTSVSSIRNNSIGGGRKNYVDTNGNNGMGSAKEVGMGFVSVGFSSNNSMSFIVKVDTDNNLGDAIVCLDILSATTIDLTFSWFNIVISTFSTTSCNYFTSILFVI